LQAFIITITPGSVEKHNANFNKRTKTVINATLVTIIDINQPLGEVQ